VKMDMLFDGGLVPDEDRALNPNQFVTLVDRTNDTHTAWAASTPRRPHPPLKRVEMPPGSEPRNREQQFALELLLDDSVQVVTCWARPAPANLLASPPGCSRWWTRSASTSSW